MTDTADGEYRVSGTLGMFSFAVGESQPFSLSGWLTPHVPIFFRSILEVADTGYGMSESILEDFFPHHIRGGTRDFSRADILWDGCLHVTTTCLSEQSVRDYSLKLGHKAINQKIAETRSQPKRHAYRGTECSITVKGNVRALQQFIVDICTKNVFVEVCEVLYGDDGEQETRCVTIFDGLNSLAEPGQDQGLDRLGTGFEDYTRKHVHNFTGERTQEEGAPRWYIKIGKAQAAVAETSRRAHSTIQACVLLVIDADEDTRFCQTEPDMQTQVIYFHNNSYILQSPTMILRAFGKVDWPSIGFQVKTVCERQGGTTPTVIQWDQYPQKVRRLDLVLHNLSDYILFEPSTDTVLCAEVYFAPVYHSAKLGCME
ncbi:hypothetical protein R1sor_000020 [Riccia sorocarpa]|uniref:Uncharacterized protein n=1 Tax=Riccia sorocarpa TaxID=122646 RepID=A0ABD3GSR3_9MARC